MTNTLRLALLIGILFYFAFILIMLHKKSMELKYSLIWFFSGIVLLVLDVFPGIVRWASGLLGIATQSNFIYLVVMFFMLLILVSLTSIVSKQNREIRRLIQKISIMDKTINGK